MCTLTAVVADMSTERVDLKFNPVFSHLFELIEMTENNEWICSVVENHSNGATPEKAPLWAPGVTLGFLRGSVLWIPSPVKN